MNTQAKVSIIFKRGHIVPRWCQVKTKDRKAQHCVTFGCDVAVTFIEGKIVIRMLTEGPLFKFRNAESSKRPMKNGTFKKTLTTIIGVTAIAAGYEGDIWPC